MKSFKKHLSSNSDNDKMSKIKCIFLIFIVYQHTQGEVRVHNCKNLESDSCDLSNIYLDAGNSTFIPGSKQNENLLWLQIVNSSIPVLQRDLCQAASNLRTMNLNNVGIKEISEGALHSCAFLDTVELANNQIHELRTDTFNQNPHLVMIDLSGNQLKSLPSDVFKGLPRLVSLYLPSNQLTTIDNVALSDLSSLHFLFLSHNPLRNFNTSIIQMMAPDKRFVSLQDTDIPCDSLKEILKVFNESNVVVRKENENPRVREYKPATMDGVTCLATV